MEEVWKDIVGYEGRYQISNLGNVKSLRYKGGKFEKNLTPKVNNYGRLWVELFKDGVGKPMLVHRLVALAFIPNTNNYQQINHKDENPKNNIVENLEWCTGEYNIQYSVEKRKCLATNMKQRNGKLSHIRIEQLDEDGKTVKVWDNSRVAAVELGFSQWSITQCCKGIRKSAYGFRWQYAI